MTDQPKKSEQPKRDEGRQYVRKDTEGNNKYQRRRGGENSRERRGNNPRDTYGRSSRYSRSTRYDRKTRDSKHQANKKLEPQTPVWSPKPSPPGSWAGIVAAAAKKLEAEAAARAEEEAEAARAEEDDNFF